MFFFDGNIRLSLIVRFNYVIVFKSLLSINTSRYYQGLCRADKLLKSAPTLADCAEDSCSLPYRQSTSGHTGTTVGTALSSAFRHRLSVSSVTTEPIIDIDTGTIVGNALFSAFRHRMSVSVGIVPTI